MAIASAPVAPSGFDGGSNERNQVSPLAPRAVNPGANPDDFSRMTVQRSAAGGGPRLVPRSSSSTGSAFAPMRLVNQLESGTSSMVLMFWARVFDGLRLEVAKSWYDRSYSRPMSQGSTLEASCGSGSRLMGSSS